jgi:hypothetical protein
MMRAYAAFAPTFWTGETGRAIKARGRDAVVMAAYLITGPSATMYGLYYLPLPTLCHEAGFTPEEARATLAVLEGLRFAQYDADAQLVWVPTMARWQIGPALHPKDRRVRGIENYLRPFLGHQYAREFIKRYGRAYSLSIKATGKPLRRPFEAPSKPGTGTETGAGTGDDNYPPTPPAGAGGSTSTSGHGRPLPTNGHGTAAGLKGAALEDAVATLIAHWRRLGSYDPKEPGGWGPHPVTVPGEQNVRAWRRALRTGRLTVDEFREGIANRVQGELMQRGVLSGYETWPPPDEADESPLELLDVDMPPDEEAHSPPGGDLKAAVRASLDRKKP